MKLNPTNLYKDAQKRLAELQQIYAEKEQKIREELRQSILLMKKKYDD